MLHGSESVDRWTAVRSAQSNEGGSEIDLAEAVRAARAGDDALTLTRVEFPAAPVCAVAVWMRSASGDTIRIALDRHTGAVLLRQRLLYDADTNARLHFGTLGGQGVRALYAISCLVGFGLLPTGATMWWINRRGRARLRDPL
jgi:uncharacterized iron-regulated membrane protein